MYENGYVPVGSSSFVGPAQAASGAITQAKKVGAEIVVLYSKYQSTATGAIPITTPTQQTSFTSGTVNAFGSAGFGTGTYQGTTTTYGSQTTYVPFSVDRYDQAALYFAPAERKGLGVQFAAMTDQQKQQAATNQGVAVVSVRKESPAFRADILPGDIVLTVGGQSTYDGPSAVRAIAAATASETEVVLFRNGQRLSKKLTIPSEW